MTQKISHIHCGLKTGPMQCNILKWSWEIGPNINNLGYTESPL